MLYRGLYKLVVRDHKLIHCGNPYERLSTNQEAMTRENFDQSLSAVSKKASALSAVQDIANCTWAFATAGHPHPEIFAGWGVLDF